MEPNKALDSNNVGRDYDKLQEIIHDQDAHSQKVDVERAKNLVNQDFERRHEGTHAKWDHDTHPAAESLEIEKMREALKKGLGPSRPQP